MGLMSMGFLIVVSVTALRDFKSCKPLHHGKAKAQREAQHRPILFEIYCIAKAPYDKICKTDELYKLLAYFLTALIF